MALDELDARSLSDLDEGRAVVVLGVDGTTWDTIEGCQVRIYSNDEDWDVNDGPMGYRVIGLDVLVRHFIKTNPLRNA